MTSRILGTSGQPMAFSQRQISGLAVGRVVHFCNGPRDDRKGPDIVAAIVTRTYDDAPGVVDLTIFLPGMHSFAQEVPHQSGDNYKDHHWSWPPKV